MKPELERYVELVRAWPGNLFSHGDLERLDEHLDDARQGVPLLPSTTNRLVDVGAGAGLPGFVLAIEAPDLQVDLVESRARKAEFLRSVCVELGLQARVRVWQGRAEELVEELGRETATVAVCRALAPPIPAAELLSPFVRPGGVLLLWTTRRLAQSIPAASSAAAQLGLGPAPSVHPTPSRLRDDGAIVCWAKTATADTRFPRRAGEATRKPLT